MRNRWVVGGAVALAVVVVAAAALWWRSTQVPELQRAVALAPASTERMTWTDWEGVRTTLGSDVDAGSGTEALTGFLDEAFEADLSPMSALVESAEAMQDSYGFSPASLEWELLAQSEDGAAVLMRLPDETDFEALGDRLERLGYQRPADDSGVWVGGRNLLPQIGTLTPELQYLALDADQHLVVGSDTAAYAGTAIAAASGEEEGVDDLDAVLEAVGDPLAAAVYGGDVVCSSLAMGSAGAAD